MSTMTNPSQKEDDALRRDRFYADMTRAEASRKRDPIAWANYTAERDAWLDATS